VTRSNPPDPDTRTTLREAAIEAELQTGKRERDRQSAGTHALLRVGRMVVASILIVAGLVMLVIPGPGLVTIAAGLVILARDVAWADRLLQQVRARLPAGEDGRLPRSTIVTMVVLGVAGIVLGVWLLTAM